MLRVKRGKYNEIEEGEETLALILLQDTVRIVILHCQSLSVYFTSYIVSQVHIHRVGTPVQVSDEVLGCTVHRRLW